MRKLTSLLIAGLVGLSSTAFAAEPTTREARMNEARQNFEAQKAGTPAKVAAPVAKKNVVAKKHGKKHAAKKHARAGKAKAATVKAAPAAVK